MVSLSIKSINPPAEADGCIVCHLNYVNNTARWTEWDIRKDRPDPISKSTPDFLPG